MKAFHDYLLKIRPLVNARGLEIAARLPRNTLGKHYRWADGKPNGQPIAWHHAGAIVRALCDTMQSKIEIKGWWVWSSWEDPAIFVQCFDETRELISEEVDGSFNYYEPQFRSVYDDFGFAHSFLSDNPG